MNHKHFDDLTQRYIDQHPNDCAFYFVSWPQFIFYALVFELALYLFLQNPLVLLTTASFLAVTIYFCCIVFRLVAVSLSLSGDGVIQVSRSELATLDDSILPKYTILVPLYNEANIAENIIANLNQLDYPKDQLDIKLLLESDDQATQEAVDRTKLGDHFDVIVVDDSQPKTKPKACNHGLQKALGVFCVIYDAEDRPEPDQLRKVVLAYQNMGSSVVCIQAKLNYYNPRQNLLTGWFTLEYTMWFDFFLPGLHRLNAPIPLGGTSNHFRTESLKELGGWDPFNVTEDCDLGIKICKAGYRTEIIESTTWEEANPKLGNWVNQRSRWMKGFFQTHIAHMRHPFKLLWALGPWRLICFWLTVGCVSLSQVLNLIYWSVGLLYLGLLSIDLVQGRNLWTVVAGHRSEHRLAWKMLFWGAGEDPTWSAISIAFFAMGTILLLANALFICINCLACTRRGNRNLLPAALISPAYWVLISLGACKGFVQLFTNRFYWEKTVHGLSEPSFDVTCQQTPAEKDQA